jgi:beta-lactam-binding protein with PASTA domain
MVLQPRRLTRYVNCILVATAALTILGVAACSSKESPTPTTDIVMPDLVGKYWTDAEPQLRSLGWTGFLIKGPDIPVGPEERNRVMTQQPPPGDRIKRDGEITLQFGL